MIRLLRLFIAPLIFLLAACATTPPSPAPRSLTILVSIDGLRPRDITPASAPTLSRFKAEGASAAMRPSFPSKTFPNHYTLVTGLRPDRHGIVENNMVDPLIPGVEFRLSNRAAVSDGRWWADGVPIWETAERNGVRTATMYWPGSEAEIHGVRPSHWLPFDQSMPAEARVDQLLTWLGGPDHPGFATLYFDDVDTAGHDDGPGSPAMLAALGKVDGALRRLDKGLKARGLTANLVIVSDHGMAQMSADRRVFVDEFLAADAGRALVMGPIMSFYPAVGHEADAEAALLRPRDHMRCWKKGELPARFEFGSHRRAPPIFCVAEVGWAITTHARDARPDGIEKGGHGFDPASPDMAATFIARGPAFRPGVVLPTFDNVSVYPLLMRLTGLPPQPNAGRLDDTAAALR